MIFVTPTGNAITPDDVACAVLYHMTQMMLGGV